MKTLKLKMKDLTNPTILSHHEIKNIMGGSVVEGCGSKKVTLTCWDGTLNREVSATTCKPASSTNLDACKVKYPNTTSCLCEEVILP